MSTCPTEPPPPTSRNRSTARRGSSPAWSCSGRSCRSSTRPSSTSPSTHLAVAFHSSLTEIQWVITGYTLALAAVIPVTGWAADRFGTKRIYLTSLVFFTLGSVLSGLAWSAGTLIFFRVLQGIGGGMIMPSVMTILTKKAGPHRMGRVMGVLGVPMLVAPIMGPILGGWLVDSASWRWIFFINVPIGIVAFILGMIVLEPDQPQPAHKLDWLGALLLSPGLAVFIYGLAESSTYGFGSARSWAPTLIGLVLIVAWFIHTWRSPNPLIDLRTFAHTRARRRRRHVLPVRHLGVRVDAARPALLPDGARRSRRFRPACSWRPAASARC